MFNLPFSKADIKAQFSAQALTQARLWVRQNRVKSLHCSADGHQLSGYVQGSDVMPCGVQIEISAADNIIIGLCSGCPRNPHCQHAAAILLEALQKALQPLALDVVTPANRQAIAASTLIDTVDDAAWYTEFESADQHWFNFELGVVVNGHTINLLPLVSGFLKKRLSQNKPAVIDPKQDYYIAVSDDQSVMLPGSRLQIIVNVITELFDQPFRDKVQALMVTNVRAAQLLSLKKKLNISQCRWYGSEHWRNIGEKLRDFKGIKPIAVPSGFKTQLRPYQQQGLDWLQFLCHYHLGGILADDMGLGKTVQVLAHLWVEYVADRLTKPSLIVAPTSLMTNWRMEITKFTPKFKVLVLHGQQRLQDFGKIESVDIVLTTYPLIVRDREALSAYDFHFLILDEAQIIKNPRAKATQILGQIKAQHRLCLTGTPMENHLTELWSLFNFLLPGFLGTQRQFRRLFQVPIEQQNESDRMQALVARIAPFMLRRTKEAVVKELPKKVEAIKCVTLQGTQADLYESIRVTLQEKIKTTIESLGFQRSRIIVLDALLKLRQTCCDPRLLKLAAAQDIEESAKLTLLMTMVPQLIEEGRSILVFSSFAQMLGLIEQEMIERGIAYVKLTGQTQDRATPIADFQAGKVKLFLISLKAGGIGLNLTAADTVIHYDPWWNPAAEMQATDRAYRIGQDKPVFVYKLITENTVEEKILKLQDKKRGLMDSLFSEKTTSKAHLSREDLDFLFES